MADGAHVVAADAGGGCGVHGIGGVLAVAAEHGGDDVERVHRELECIEIRAELDTRINPVSVVEFVIH